jgi:hypothetical protein
LPMYKGYSEHSDDFQICISETNLNVKFTANFRKDVGFAAKLPQKFQHYGNTIN